MKKYYVAEFWKKRGKDYEFIDSIIVNANDQAKALKLAKQEADGEYPTSEIEVRNVHNIN